MKRAMDAGGAFTWNVPRRSYRFTRRDRDGWYLSNNAHLDFMK